MNLLSASSSARHLAPARRRRRAPQFASASLPRSSPPFTSSTIAAAAESIAARSADAPSVVSAQSLPAAADLVSARDQSASSLAPTRAMVPSRLAASSVVSYFDNALNTLPQYVAASCCLAPTQPFTG